MASVQIYRDTVIKREYPRFPEEPKYLALNAVNAPIVRLLDAYTLGQERYLVLQRAAPLNLDTRRAADFERVIRWSLKFSSAQVPSYPLCDVAYIKSYWQATTALIALARNDHSSVYDPHLNDCPAPAVVLEAFLRALRDNARAVVHADPADFNLGTVNGRIVAYDLGLSCLENPFTDLALRTGASTMPYPQHTPPRARRAVS